MKKATALAPANIAFIKYWGRKKGTPDKEVIPANSSISMNIDNCYTKTTVEFSPEYKQDKVWIKFFGKDYEKVSGPPLNRVLGQVDRLRELNHCVLKVKIMSANSFPSDAGIAASASGFSALTLALVGAFEMKVSLKELSILVRLSGSGSACRSVVDGFAEWHGGNNSQTSYAKPLAPPEWWDLVDLVTVVKDEKKKFSSLEGHALASTSPFYARRLQLLRKRIPLVRKAIKEKNISALGPAIEEEATEMHLIAMSAKTPIFYWNEGTMEIIQAVQRWRANNLPVFFTIDAGPNVHLICLEKDNKKLLGEIKKLKNVLFTITNRPCNGARLIEKHLF